MLFSGEIRALPPKEEKRKQGGERGYLKWGLQQGRGCRHCNRDLSEEVFQRVREEKEERDLGAVFDLFSSDPIP